MWEVSDEKAGCCVSNEDFLVCLVCFMSLDRCENRNVKLDCDEKIIMFYSTIHSFGHSKLK